MSVINNIKRKIGDIKLKKAQHRAVKRQFINWNDVRKVQILFNRTNQTEVGILDYFIDKLIESGKQVELLNYVDSKKNDTDIEINRKYSYFYRKDLNWFGKPHDKVYHKFIEQTSDLLIVIDFNDMFHFRWIATLSRAQTIATVYSQNNKWANILLKIERDNIEHFLEQVVHYLKLINVK